MIEAIIAGLFEFLVEYFLLFLFWLLMFPVVWLVTLPFILVLALFDAKPYSRAAMRMINDVHEFWGRRIF